MTFETHIRNLASEYFVKIKWISKAINACCNAKKRTIEIAQVRGDISYCVALHEIAHTLIDTADTYENERIAWLWAKKNALRWTDRMENEMCQSLKHYQDWLKE